MRFDVTAEADESSVASTFLPMISMLAGGSRFVGRFAGMDAAVFFLCVASGW